MSCFCRALVVFLNNLVWNVCYIMGSVSKYVPFSGRSDSFWHEGGPCCCLRLAAAYYPPPPHPHARTHLGTVLPALTPQACLAKGGGLFLGAPNATWTLQWRIQSAGQRTTTTPSVIPWYDEGCITRSIAFCNTAMMLWVLLATKYSPSTPIISDGHRDAKMDRCPPHADDMRIPIPTFPTLSPAVYIL